MQDILSLISKIHDKGNSFIIHALRQHSVRGLVPSHGDILSVLYNTPQITMKELADKIHRTRPTVTVLVDKLEKLQFVRRRPSKTDSRVTYVILTPQGKKFEPVFETISNQLIERLYQPLSTSEQKTLYTLLGKIAQLDDLKNKIKEK